MSAPRGPALPEPGGTGHEPSGINYAPAVLFRQVLHPDLGCASYLIADTAAGSAAVVDPKWEIGEYLALAAAQDVRIEHIVETHNHADHLSGRPRLAALTGARCWASPSRFCGTNGGWPTSATTSRTPRPSPS